MPNNLFYNVLSILKMKDRTASFVVVGLGHLTFLTLAGLSLWFWRERTLILDAAFQSYLLVNTGTPAIMVERFGIAAIQVLPLLGIWVGLPLMQVLMLFSVSYVLFHWAAFAWCWHKMRHPKAAAGILGVVLLLSSDCFYWMQNELLPALSLLFVLIAHLENTAKHPMLWRNGLLTALLVFTILYLHPLVVFPVAFVGLYFFQQNSARVSPRQLWQVALLFGLAFSIKYLFQAPNFYDRGMTGQFVRELDWATIQSLWNSRCLYLFWDHCADGMILFWPILFLILVFYASRQQFRVALLCLSFVLAYGILLFVRFRADERWYIAESHLQAWSVFFLLPLLWEVIPTWFFNRKWLFLLLLLLIFRMAGVFQAHHFYTKRVAYVESLLRKNPHAEGSKITLRPDQINENILLMRWGLPFETLHCSALQSPDSARTIVVVPTPGQIQDAVPTDSMVSFLMLPRRAFRDLPAQYYRVEDESGYREGF
jgi:hypothetical protein